MTIRVRFAPSPTGHLHLGNARTALVNWLFARAAGGAFLLRLDDTDAERSTPAFAAAIESDLQWLGLDWDECARQSDRMARYAAAAEALKASGRLYPCYETSDELETKRRLLQARRLPPLYDRAALKLSDVERARLEAEGRKPHWRFLLNRTSVQWDDLVRGPTSIDTTSVSDPVLVRADGVPLYTLASVVDDVDHAITHVIRGEDHVTNTAVQVEIAQALGATAPAYAHLALLVGTSGEGLSKREGALSLRDLRAQGTEPLAIGCLLARLGTSRPVEAKENLAALAADFALDDFGRAPARFDPAELAALSARVLHHLPFAEIAHRLPRGVDEVFWLAVRGNIATVAEAADWAEVVHGPVPAPPEADRAFLAQAAALLPPAPFDATSWPTFTKAVQAATGQKGKALFLPLRRALTGREHGPEMKDLLPLIGHDAALARLKA